MYGSDLFIPHEHPLKTGGESEKPGRLTRIIAAVTLQICLKASRLESYSDQAKAAWGLTIGIALQDFPEEASVPIQFLKLGKSRGRAVLLGVLSGLVEPLGALLSSLLIQAFQWLLPFFLSFGAGVMIYVIGSEMIPEAHSSGFGKDTMLFMVLGFITMMILDTLL